MELEKKLIKEQYPYFIYPNGDVESLGFNVKCKRGRRDTTKKLLKPCIRNGYYSFRLNLTGKFKWYVAHRLVAKIFIPNPNNLPQVNHKDGNKLNNNVDNLEWCTQSHNTQHAYDTGLLIAPGNRKGFCGKLNVSSIPIVQLTLQGDFVREWESIALTSQDGFMPTAVGKACKKQLTKHKNFKWMHKQEYERIKTQVT